MDPFKDYLGDGVYVEWDGYALSLYTSNGVSISDHITLDDSVVHALLRTIKRINPTFTYELP